jgi:uncharacterized protein YhaN
VRVDRLSVRGFGKLAARELRFGPGLTVVHGPNESGKSTTHAALRAALFGLTAGGRRTRDETAALERFRPWCETGYGAVAELTDAGGRRLRVEWDYDRCRFAVLDAATGADLSGSHGAGTDPRALAQALYGVDREVYLRVGCVEQAELDRIGEPGSVRHAVEVALTRSQPDTSARAAIDALRAHRSQLVGLNRARGNPLPGAESERDEVRVRLDAAERARADLEGAAAERDAARETAAQAAEQVHRLESARRHLLADELRRRLEAAEQVAAAQADAARTLAANPDGGEFTPVDGMPALRGRMEDLAAELAGRAQAASADAGLAARLDERAAELERRIGELSPHRGAAERAAAVEAAAVEASRSRRPVAAMLVAAAGVAVAAVGAVTGAAALIGAGALAAVAGAVAALAAGRGRTSDLDRLLPGPGPRGARLAGFRTSVERDRELAAAERELAGIRVEAAEARGRLAGVAQIEAELAGVRERIGAALHGCAIDAADLDDGLRRYDRFEAAAHSRREATQTRTRTAGELRRLLGDDSLEQARERLERLEQNLNGHGHLAAGRDPDDVERELAAARAAHERAATESEHLAARIAERLRALPDAGALREQLDAAEERVARLRHVEHVLKLAESELTEAAADTYRDFAPLLNAALEDGMATLTGGRYTRAFVDEDLSVRLEAPETGAVVDLDRLSVGTRKQAYLVQRLALVRLLCPSEEPLPVLLDDPFAHFDADRLARTLAWLAEAAAERQIIVFATQRRVAELLPPGAAIIQL